MALLLKSELDRPVVFVHVHKTGGSWASKVLEDMGVVEAEVGHQHSQAEAVLKAYPDAWIFGFVRDPFDFLRSYFLHRYRHEVWVDRDLDRICQSDRFHLFLNKYLTHLPGWVGNWFEAFVGPAEFVGKFDNLREDLKASLTAARVPFDPAFIDAEPPYNVTPAVYPLVWDLGEREQHYRKAVRNYEQFAYNKWFPEES